MKVFAVALALSVTLAATPTFAQAQAQPARPPAPTAQTPAPAAPATPPKPFPEGVKYGFVVLQQIASESKDGKAAAAKITALQQQKTNELNEKNKTLQAAQQRLEQGGNVLSETARAQLQTDIDRQQRDIQRFTEDAQQDIANLQNQVQDEFQRRLVPVLGQVAQARQLHFILSATDSGLVWGDPSLDLTQDVIKALDAAPAPAASTTVPTTPSAAAPAPKSPATTGGK